MGSEKKLTSIDFQVGQQQAFAQIIRIKPSFKRSMHSRLKMMADRVVSLHSTASSFSHVALLLPSNHGDCMQTWSVVVLIALSRGWWGNCYNLSYLCIQNDYYIFSELSLFLLCKYKHESIKAIWNITSYLYTYTPHPIYLWCSSNSKVVLKSSHVGSSCV